LDSTITTTVNSPSSADGLTRDEKETSRLLPVEGGLPETLGPQLSSEIAGGADRSPEGKGISDCTSVAVAAEPGKTPRCPDEDRSEFTKVILLFCKTNMNLGETALD